ncbi:MAG: metallophosphoesterase family protein [Butyrivibrio sp.]|uniref:metallophosphoesterase n=1 Tax=Butyrivibrio sp. TaxID=28121 RepID=UPI001AFD4AC4|nr:metallophosphoesterase [Butyrivibrio sp.]MBO6239956.1 metallophosphoesterase family protein [Butyrivibrio sp.]
MIYYIADCHFYHAALNTKMDKRGFLDVNEMNEYMIRKWNEKVTNADTVVILGDLSLGNVEETNDLIHRLKGKLCLIIGNHDKYVGKPGFDAGRFEWIDNYREITDSQKKVICCHYPMPFYEGQYRKRHNGDPKTYMLYGHVHESRDEMLMQKIIDMIRNSSYIPIGSEKEDFIPCNMINCFCKRSDYTPLTLTEWIRYEKGDA